MSIDKADLERLAELGVFDPQAADADEIIDYLDWLADEGFDVVELAELTQLDHFGALTTQMKLRPDAKPLDVYGDADLDAEQIARLASAFGFDRDTVAKGHYTPTEIEVFRSSVAGTATFSSDEITYFGQVTGASLARIAEAAVSLFMVDIEAPLMDADLTRRERSILSAEADEGLELIVNALAPLFRLHMTQAIERLHHGAEAAGSQHGVRQAIGFVDLVGFTTLSASMPIEELSVLVREFEAVAHDVVAGCGARVVKIIGDAVMFTALDPDAVLAAGRALLGRLGDRTNVEARGGITYGDVLIRGGDYYGPVVNLASRLGDLAVPGELLATPEFAAALEEATPFEPAGWRQLKGFVQPVNTVSFRPDASV